MKGIPFAAILALSALAKGQGLVPEKLQQETARLRDSAAGSHAEEIARSLCDRVGSRLSGSPGSRKAVEWALEEFRRLGFENVHPETLMEPRWERGIETGEILAPASYRLALTALGGSPGTKASGLSRTVVGTESIESLAELLKREPDAVRGKIVYFNRRMARTQDGAGYGDAVKIRWAGPESAARAGAAAVLIRSVGTSGDRLPHTGATKPLEKKFQIPSAAVSAPDADLLERLLSGESPVEVRLTLGCRSLPDAEGANVVGEIRGSELPGEIVLAGAHLDSWDLATGALDDAAGVGIISEAARLIARLPRRPRRTIRLVLFANEENGGKGGEAYEAAHRLELENHVAALEMDLGTDRVYSFSALAAPGAGALLAPLAEILKPIGISTLEGEAAGADISAYRAEGVPMLELNQDASRYFDVHHSADDTFDKIDPAAMRQAVAATAAVLYYVADLPATLGRVPAEKRTVKKW